MPSPSLEVLNDMLADHDQALELEAQGQEPQAAPAQEPQAAPAQEPQSAPAQDPQAAPVEDDLPSLIPSDILPVNNDVEEVTSDVEVSEDDPIQTPFEIAKDEKSNVAFAKLRSELKRVNQQLIEKDAEIERLTTHQTPDLEEVQNYRNKVAELEEQLARYDLASTEKFKQQYDAPMEQVLSNAVNMLKRNGRDPEEARDLFKKLVGAKTAEAMQELVADEPYAIQGALINAANRFLDMSEERQEALDKWQETKASVDFQERRDAKIRLMENVEQGMRNGLQAALKAGNWMYQTSADNEEWNTQVDQRTKAAAAIIRRGDPSEIAALVLEGVTAQDTRALALNAIEQGNALRAKLKAVTAAQPSFDGGDTSTAPAAPMDPGKGISPGDFIDQIMS